MEFIIIFWMLSYLIMGLIGIILRVKIFSNYYLFFGFSLLYTLIPLLVSQGINPSIFVTLSLNDRADLVSTHLAVTALANFFYAFGAYFIFSNRKRRGLRKIIFPRRSARLILGDKSVAIIFIILGIILIFGGYKYPWLSPERTDTINSLMGQGKVILCGLYIYILAFYGIGSKTMLMLLMIIVVTMFEHSRTSLIAVTFGTLVMAQEEKKISTLMLIFAALTAALFFVLIAIYRTGFRLSDLSSIADMFFPVFVEGSCGSYMNLQVYDLFNKGEQRYTYFLNYLIDPLAYMLPRPILNAMSIDKDSLTIFGNWITWANGSLSETFAPLGGFFYVAEASAALPYLGPAIVAFVFGSVTQWIDNKKDEGLIGTLNFLIFTIGFSMFFIKHNFAASTHFFITTLLVVYSGYFFSQALNILFSRKKVNFG